MAVKVEHFIEAGMTACAEVADGIRVRLTTSPTGQRRAELLGEQPVPLGSIDCDDDEEARAEAIRLARLDLDSTCASKTFPMPTWLRGC